eukprot:14622821-Heterocapsa_arctica.AAC.1
MYHVCSSSANGQSSSSTSAHRGRGSARPAEAAPALGSALSGATARVREEAGGGAREGVAPSATGSKGSREAAELLPEEDPLG